MIKTMIIIMKLMISITFCKLFFEEKLKGVLPFASPASFSV